ncbi:MAG: glycerol-3-phosphate 1-O-acyltransferase PlsY [Puniceicoccales bacterium]|jgi:glycerol-3-phosphate acyltransferase PlsY|nr:glycerol-3-phosphate 1-O-acyltransferase PlsY [Puniceicoccales bacterium]
MCWCWYIVTVVVTYLVGSISFGAFLARINKVDVFSIGSGSPGATNIKRTLGNRAGNLVFALDFLKGYIPTVVIAKNFPGEGHLNIRLAALGLIGVLLGHSFSLFHGFRGGKGVASAMGGFLAIMPNTLVVGIFFWLVIFHATRIVSMASLCFIASTILTSYLFSYPKDCVICSVIISMIVFWRHRENIIRLINGTEYKFTKKS